MTPKYVSGCVKLLLELTAFLMFVCSTSTTQQCTPKETERDSYVIRNVGIKLCQLKCAENGQCLSIEYNIATLTCRLSRAELKTTKKKEGRVILARNHSNVPSGSCTSSMCSFGERCLKTRSGKAACVQALTPVLVHLETSPNKRELRVHISSDINDEKQNDFETSPEPKVDKQETFANSSLHEACRRGDLNRVERILSQGLVDINIRDKENGKTPLMVAAKEGHCRIFDLLIRKGANMSEVDNDCKNGLHWACKGGHVSMLKCVLQQYRKNVNDRKIRLLALAAYSGQKDLCEFLVCMGTNVSGHYQGSNVLDFACRGGHVDVVKYLLSQGSVDINSRGKDGKTPLMGTASVGRRVAFDFLVRRGANMSLVDDEGYNVLHIAASLDQTEIIQSIISNDIVDINSRGRNGTTPLMRAACTGHMDVFGLLVRNGGLADLVDDNGGNILHLASSGGHVEMVKHILSRKLVDINDRDKDGKTAAMIAKRDRKRNVLDFLVSQGCPVK